MERAESAISSTCASVDFADDDHEAGISDSDIENLEEITDLNNATLYDKTAKTISAKILPSELTLRTDVASVNIAAVTCFLIGNLGGCLCYI